MNSIANCTILLSFLIFPLIKSKLPGSYPWENTTINLTNYEKNYLTSLQKSYYPSISTSFFTSCAALLLMGALDMLFMPLLLTCLRTFFSVSPPLVLSPHCNILHCHSDCNSPDGALRQDRKPQVGSILSPPCYQNLD